MSFAFVKFGISQTSPVIVNESDSSKVYMTVSAEAQFPGGDYGWSEFLRKNLNPDVPVEKGAKKGKYTVIVRFVIHKDGSISDTKCENDPGYGMCQEFLRLFKIMPKWIPANVNGESVNAWRRQPVTFLVE